MMNGCDCDFCNNVYDDETTPIPYRFYADPPPPLEIPVLVYRSETYKVMNASNGEYVGMPVFGMTELVNKLTKNFT